MSVFADLERRTGVGAGGVLLYVTLLGAVVAGVELVGDLPTHAGSVRLVAFVPGLIVAVGLLGVVSAASNLPRAVRIAAATRRWGDSAARTGTLEPSGGVLRSPVRNEDALCYTYRILENDTDDDPMPEDETNWSLAAMGDDGTAFALRTDDGGESRVRVDPSAADYHIAGREETALLLGESEPDALRTLRREAGIERREGTAYRFQESTLAPGDDAFVLGARGDGQSIEGGDPFVVADEGYPGRVRGRITAGLLLGVPTTAVGALGLLFVGGAL